MTAQPPAPEQGFVLTHFLVVSDQDRSRDFYTRVLGAEVVRERHRLPALGALKHRAGVEKPTGSPEEACAPHGSWRRGRPQRFAELPWAR